MLYFPVTCAKLFLPDVAQTGQIKTAGFWAWLATYHSHRVSRFQFLFISEKELGQNHQGLDQSLLTLIPHSLERPRLASRGWVFHWSACIYSCFFSGPHFRNRLKEHDIQSRRDGSAVKIIGSSSRAPGLDSQQTLWDTLSVCNSSPRSSHDLFWLLWLLHAHGDTETYIGKTTYMHGKEGCDVHILEKENMRKTNLRSHGEKYDLKFTFGRRATRPLIHLLQPVLQQK